MKALTWLLAATTLLTSGCAADDGTSAGAVPPAPAATVTVTATATATVTVPVEPAATDPAALDDPSAPPRPPDLALRVFEDGCGVIRSEAAPGVSYDNLTWTVLDQNGFQVLGRNAEGETRYRFYQGGSFRVVLEAFVDGAYRPVSNKVTVRC